jgi:tetratricopeptide (TPR) repeat protein
MAATTGTLGLISYLALIGFSVYLLLKLKNWAILAGYGAILVTNFFGFSVVPTQIQLFLFPALALGLNKDNLPTPSLIGFSKNRKSLIAGVALTIALTLFVIGRYWYADTLYAKGKASNSAGNYLEAQKNLAAAVKLSPHEAVYRGELSVTYSAIVSALISAKEKESAGEIATAAITESNRAMALSPANINLYRTRATVFLRLSALDQKYLGTAKDALLSAATRAPTEAKILYNLALVLTRTGEVGTATQVLQKTIELKSNYKDARYLYALLLEGQGNYAAAQEQLTYILEKIDPNDKNSASELQKLK